MVFISRKIISIMEKVKIFIGLNIAVRYKSKAKVN